MTCPNVLVALVDDAALLFSDRGFLAFGFWHLLELLYHELWGRPPNPSPSGTHATLLQIVAELVDSPTFLGAGVKLSCTYVVPKIFFCNRQGFGTGLPGNLAAWNRRSRPAFTKSVTRPTRGVTAAQLFPPARKPAGTMKAPVTMPRASTSEQLSE